MGKSQQKVAIKDVSLHLLVVCVTPNCCLSKPADVAACGRRPLARWLVPPWRQYDIGSPMNQVSVRQPAGVAGCMLPFAYNYCVE